MEEITENNAGDILIELRASGKVTQKEISEKTGIAVRTLRLLESGEQKPHKLTIYKLKKYFETIGV